METDRCIVIQDLHPRTRYHYLVIPKRHIKNIWYLQYDDDELVEHMIETVKRILPQDDVKFGFHSPYITRMNHLHMHAMRGDLKVSRLRFWIEFGNKLLFKDALEYV